MENKLSGLEFLTFKYQLNLSDKPLPLSSGSGFDYRNSLVKVFHNTYCDECDRLGEFIYVSRIFEGTDDLENRGEIIVRSSLKDYEKFDNGLISLKDLFDRGSKWFFIRYDLGTLDIIENFDEIKSEKYKKYYPKNLCKHLSGNGFYGLITYRENSNDYICNIYRDKVLNVEKVHEIISESLLKIKKEFDIRFKS